MTESDNEEIGEEIKKPRKKKKKSASTVTTETNIMLDQTSDSLATPAEDEPHTQGVAKTPTNSETSSPEEDYDPRDLIADIEREAEDASTTNGELNETSEMNFDPPENPVNDEPKSDPTSTNTSQDPEKENEPNTSKTSKEAEQGHEKPTNKTPVSKNDPGDLRDELRSSRKPCQ